MNKTYSLLFLITSILIVPVTSIAAQDHGEKIYRAGTIVQDYYAAGDHITIDARAKGDVIVAGGEVSIGHTISQDILAAGGSLRLRGQVNDDVRVAGGEVNIDARIGDDLVAAGGEITIEPLARVGGNAYLAGGDVEMSGTVNGDLFVGAGELKIAGVVKGDVNIEGGEITIVDGAHIGGNLNYKSYRKAKIDPGAVIRGKTKYTEYAEYGPHRGFRFLSILMFAVAGIVLFLVFPKFTLAASGRMASHFWKHLGLGFALLVTVPIAAILLMGLVVGVWVGLPVLATYFVALLTAFLVSAFFLAENLARVAGFDVATRGRRIVALIVAMLVLALVSLVPVLGGLAIFVLLVTALGAETMQVYEVYRGGKNLAPVPVRKKSKKKKSRGRSG